MPGLRSALHPSENCCFSPGALFPNRVAEQSCCSPFFPDLLSPPHSGALKKGISYFRVGVDVSGPALRSWDSLLLDRGGGGVQADLHNSNKLRATQEAATRVSFLEEKAQCIPGMMEGWQSSVRVINSFSLPPFPCPAVPEGASGSSPAKAAASEWSWPRTHPKRREEL